MQTIVEALNRHGREKKDDVFCHFLKGKNTETITYAVLLDNARRYACFFQSQGLSAGNVVLIVFNHTPDMYYAFLGAMMCNLIPAFMPYPTGKQDPKIYWESHRELFNRTGAGALLTYPEHGAAVGQHMPNLPLRVLTDQDALPYPATPKDVPIEPKSTAFLQHSSGTTGLKKGVALSHQAVLEQVRSYTSALQLNEQDRIVTWLPLYHDMGLIACFLLPLIAGIPIVQLDPFEWVAAPKLLFEAIHHYKPSLCWMPNFAFQHFCRTVRCDTALDLRSMRAWINCSEPCKSESFALFLKKFSPMGVAAFQLQVCYAMAETVFAVTQTKPGSLPKEYQADREQVRSLGCVLPAVPGRPSTVFLSTGRPVSVLDVKIVNELGQSLADDEIGEIAITGSCLFSGYYKRIEETQKKLRDGWYFTGDLGFWHDDELYITGRKNDLIIVHGRNYYAHEIEAVVNQVPEIKAGRAVAFGYFLPAVGSEEMVVIAESGAPSDSHSRIAAAIKQHLLDTSGLLPYDVRLVPQGWLVKTTSGKLSRRANSEKYAAELLPVSA